MKLRLKNLNVWQRIGIILSFLWAISWLLYSLIVIFTPPKDVFEKAVRGLWELRFIFGCLMKAIIPIIIGWLGIYGTLWLFRWVREGFKHNKEEMKKALPGEKISNQNSSMNKKQKTTILIGVGIIVLMGMIPPWYYDQVYLVLQGPRLAIDAGYGFLFSPPPCPRASSFILGGIGRPRIDIPRLFFQWIVVGFAMGGILFVLRDFKKDRP